MMGNRLFKTGLIHVHFGDGQGKTSAAVGLAVRACGCGGSVLFAQFLKNGRSGELETLRKLEGVELAECPPCDKFFYQMDERERAQASAEQSGFFQDMIGRVRSGGYDLLVMDEIIDAVHLGMISREEFLEFLKNKPENLEVVLTGHQIFPELTAVADYVTEVKKIKHPYDNGIRARRGAEV